MSTLVVAIVLGIVVTFLSRPLLRRSVDHPPPLQHLLTATTATAALSVPIASPTSLPTALGICLTGVPLALVDAKHHRLPNPPLALSWIIGLAVAASTDHLLGSIAATLATLAATIALVLLAGAGSPLGGGDIKLVGVIATWLYPLGIPAIFTGLTAGTCLIGLLALALILNGHAKEHRIPAGPALLAGAWAAAMLA